LNDAYTGVDVIFSVDIAIEIIIVVHLLFLAFLLLKFPLNKGYDKENAFPVVFG